ncbi:hypothetical protein VF14_10965 [Nostoc linckia z18]|uniref:Uncharacterized protein n=2 Tax=Nostoc linckia TaxID=92942 RepID=A0A9Q5ZET8_NOSLI|nr:hypothetical protein [Nostoc linckia]PHK40114.1 hypothetical protein VF12_11775 [Nostoc linckia z15]PHK46248.1 hypothetical protein VF13_11790 [Nostoc linckia z16]PHJ66503.1 hypothetical protein VF02_07965 [Nostoc linckia z1]PHJ71377.1 hypothetical protein VF05_07825 [Nostoc linckia z3]PHJ75409.1 hypothetical protein VF03_10865 [Nostoc linckia z2]
MSKLISTLDLLVELTTEEQQLLSGGQSSPDQPPIDDGNRDGNGLKNLTNRLSIANPIPK